MEETGEGYFGVVHGYLNELSVTYQGLVDLLGPDFAGLPEIDAGLKLAMLAVLGHLTTVNGIAEGLGVALPEGPDLSKITQTYEGGSVDEHQLLIGTRPGNYLVNIRNLKEQSYILFWVMAANLGREFTADEIKCFGLDDDELARLFANIESARSKPASPYYGVSHFLQITPRVDQERGQTLRLHDQPVRDIVADAAEPFVSLPLQKPILATLPEKFQPLLEDGMPRVQALLGQAETAAAATAGETNETGSRSQAPATSPPIGPSEAGSTTAAAATELAPAADSPPGVDDPAVRLLQLLTGEASGAPEADQTPEHLVVFDWGLHIVTIDSTLTIMLNGEPVEELSFEMPWVITALHELGWSETYGQELFDHIKERGDSFTAADLPALQTLLTELQDFLDTKGFGSKFIWSVETDKLRLTGLTVAKERRGPTLPPAPTPPVPEPAAPPIEERQEVNQYLTLVTKAGQSQLLISNKDSGLSEDLVQIFRGAIACGGRTDMYKLFDWLLSNDLDWVVKTDNQPAGRTVLRGKLNTLRNRLQAFGFDYTSSSGKIRIDGLSDDVVSSGSVYRGKDPFPLPESDPTSRSKRRR